MFSTGRREEVPGVDVLLLLGAVLGVVEVAIVVAVSCVSSARLDDAHGAPATATLSCTLSRVQRRKEGGTEREKEAAAAEGEREEGS